MLPHFFYHPRMLAYDFGPRHPLKPERLRRTVELLAALGPVEFKDPGLAQVKDLERVHTSEYVDAVRRLDESLAETGEVPDPRFGYRRQGREFDGHGFGSLDNPPFIGIWDASRAYAAGTVAAAERVRDGSPLAFGISGGLHHAMRSRASGFCVFNDAAVALHVLRERFERVAYVDIDVHHGDGVQWIFYDDPSVLTYSIHEDPRTLFPGTGSIDETGAGFSSLNMPLPAGTTGDVWLEAFERTALPAIARFSPGAIVLQLGTDAHDLDPLGHLRLTSREWLGAVSRIRELGLPIVAVGGGGYHLQTVPRMWAAACLTLAGMEVPEWVPEPLASQWGMPRFHDPHDPAPRRQGEPAMLETIAHLVREHELV
jgi:acetoin utilization protein AcuC